jgi:TP901 family phage tail tape measure protein
MAVQAGFANLTAVAMRTMDHLNSAMGVVSSTALAFGLVSTLVAGYATDAAADYEQSMQMVKAVSKGSAEDFANLSNKAKEMSMQYGMSANEIAGQLQTLGRAGIGASAQMSVFESAMKMSKLEAMDLETSIEGLVKMVGLFGTSVNDPGFGEKAKEMATDLTHASQIAPTTVEDLMQGLQFVGGVAKVAGATQRETLAALSYMSTLGVSGSMAGTALRGFYTKPTLQQPQVKEAMAEIGISPESLWLPDQSAAKPLWEQVKIINEAMKKAGMSAFEKMGIWSKIGMQKTAQQMMKIDEGEMQAYYEKMDEQFDLDEKVAIAMDSLNEQFSRFKSALEVLAISIGDYFVPILRFLVDGLNGLANGLADNKILAGGLAAVLGFGMVAAMVALSYWAYEIVRFLVKAKTLSGVIAALNGASTQATGAAIANTAAMEAKAGASGFAASVAPVGIGRVAPNPNVSGSIAKSVSSPLVTSTGAAVGAQKAIGKIGEESAKSSVKSAAAGGVMAGTFGKIKGAATGAFNSIKSGASAAWAALLGMGPAGWAVVGVLVAIAAAAYIGMKLWERYAGELKPIQERFDKAKKSGDEYLESIKSKMRDVEGYDPTIIHIDINDSKFKEKVKETQDSLDALVAKKEQSPIEMGIFGESYWTKASEGPATYGEHTKYGKWTGPGEMDYSEAHKATLRIGEIYSDIEDYYKFEQAVMADTKMGPKTKAQYLKEGQAQFQLKAGIAPVDEKTGRTQAVVTAEIKEYTDALRYQWINQQKGTILTKEYARLQQSLWFVIVRVLKFFGFWNEAAATQSEQLKDGKKSADSSSSAIKKMNDQQWNAMKASLWLEYQLYRMSNAIMWVADVTAAFIEYIKSVDLQSEVKAAGYSQVGGLPVIGGALQWGLSKFGFSENTEATKTLTSKINETSSKYGTPYSEDWGKWFAPQSYDQYTTQKLNELGPSWPGEGMGYLSPGDASDTGTGEGGTGSGKGAGGDGAKSSIKKDGYTIDFVLCSKKTLPPLDPNLFKKSKILDLTQKSFKIDNLNINTTDKPANINAAVRKTIVDISESNRVNPREVTTTEV